VELCHLMLVIICSITLQLRRLALGLLVGGLALFRIRLAAPSVLCDNTQFGAGKALRALDCSSLHPGTIYATLVWVARWHDMCYGKNHANERASLRGVHACWHATCCSKTRANVGACSHGRVPETPQRWREMCAAPRPPKNTDVYDDNAS
jgi:hypothetical protein